MHLSDLAVDLYVLWVLGVLIGLVRLVLAGRYTRRLRSACRPVEQTGAHSVLQELSEQMKVRRLPELLSRDQVGPLLLDTSHPAIVLPVEMLAEDNAEYLRLALAHELAHLRRRDLLWNSIPVLAETLFFFHPLIWLAARESQLAQEIACDELAIRSASTSSADYAEMLVDAASKTTPSPHRALVAVGVSESFQTLTRRIHAMRRTHGSTRTQLLVAGLIVVLLAVISLIAFRSRPHTVTLPANGVIYSKLIVSPDGKHVSVNYSEDATKYPGRTAQTSDETYEIRNLATGVLEHRIKYRGNPGIGSSYAAFSPDSHSLLVSHLNMPKEQPLLLRLIPHQRHERFIASQIDRFDLGSGKMANTIPNVRAFWINGDGKTLWTTTGYMRPVLHGGSGSTTLIRRDFVTGKELVRPSALPGDLIDISPDGKKVITNCYTDPVGDERNYEKVSLVVWELPSGKQLVTLEGLAKYPTCAHAFSADGSMFAGTEGTRLSFPLQQPVHVWETDTGKIKFTLTGNRHNIHKLAFSPDGRKVAGLDEYGCVNLWKIGEPDLSWSFHHGREAQYDIAFTPDSTQLVVVTTVDIGTPQHAKHIPGPILILDAETGKPIRAINP